MSISTYLKYALNFISYKGEANMHNTLLIGEDISSLPPAEFMQVFYNNCIKPLKLNRVKGFEALYNILTHNTEMSRIAVTEDDLLLFTNTNELNEFSFIYRKIKIFLVTYDNEYNNYTLQRFPNKINKLPL